MGEGRCVWGQPIGRGVDGVVVVEVMVVDAVAIVEVVVVVERGMP